MLDRVLMRSRKQRSRVVSCVSGAYATIVSRYDKRYNDRQICGEVGIQIRQQPATVRPKVNLTRIYPNPANETVTLEYHLETTNPSYFELYSTLGKKLQSNSLTGNKGQETISTIQLPPGIYHYRIVSDNTSVAFGKLVIAR